MITDKQKIKIFEKNGYTLDKIGNKYTLCVSASKLAEFQNVIDENYLHIYKCCEACKKKIYARRRKMKVRR